MAGEPTHVIEGAEMLVATRNNEFVYFLTNKALVESSDTDLSLARLRSPTQLKRISVKQFSQIDEMLTTEERLDFISKLDSWNLKGPIQTMNALRKSTIGTFPNLEPFLNDKATELTLEFSGSKT